MSMLSLLGLSKAVYTWFTSVQLRTLCYFPATGSTGPALRRGEVELSLYYNRNQTKLFFLQEVPNHPHQAAFFKFETADI